MNSKLRVFFIPTQGSSVMYWRVQAWVEAAYRIGAAQMVNPLWFKDLNGGHQPWQSKITNGPDYDAYFIRAFIPMIESGARQADVIVMQYPQEEGALELFDSLKMMFPNTPILTEIDDNVISIPTYNLAAESYSPHGDNRERVLKQLRGSDGLIVSTPYLKEVYAEFNDNIHIVENSIDFKLWGKVKRGSKPGIRIGWAGGAGHEGDFEPIEGAIHRIAERNKDVRFCFVNGPCNTGLPQFLKSVPRVEHRAIWKPILKYPQMLGFMDYDIGIAPMRDSAFNRGKSNLKWLENSALGIPTVAARVGHMAETVRDCYDGFLYSDEAEFEKRLTELVRDRQLRSMIGSKAQDRVRRDFNTEVNVFKYVDVLKSAIEYKKNKPAKKDETWASGEVIARQTFEMRPEVEARISVEGVNL